MGETTVGERDVDEATRSRRRPTRAKRTILAVLGAAVVALVGWQVVVQSALAGVRVVYDALPVACEGGEVGLAPAIANDDLGGADGFFFDEQMHHIAIDVQPDLDCGIRVHVVNDGWATVGISEATLPGLGESVNSLVVPVSVSPNPLGGPIDREGDAVLLMDGLLVAPDTSQVLVFRVQSNPSDDDAFTECGAVTPLGPRIVVTVWSAVRQIAAPPEGDIVYASPLCSDPVSN